MRRGLEILLYNYYIRFDNKRFIKKKDTVTGALISIACGNIYVYAELTLTVKSPVKRILEYRFADNVVGIFTDVRRKTN